jgi:hypothetical protein
MRIDEKVICKKDFLNDHKTLVFKIDAIYLVKEREDYKDVLIVRIKGENDYFHWFSTKDISDDNYFYNYFESFAEFREKRIDSILDE